MTPATTSTNATTTSPTKNGYPMSPTNAAISFANHHHRMGAATTSSKDSPNRQYQQQQQQYQQFKQSQQQQQPQHFSPLFSNLANAIDLDLNKNNSSSFNDRFAAIPTQQQQPPMFQQQQFGGNAALNFQSGTSLPLHSTMKSFAAKVPANSNSSSTTSFLGPDLFDFTSGGGLFNAPHDLLKTGTD